MCVRSLAHLGCATRYLCVDRPRLPFRLPMHVHPPVHPLCSERDRAWSHAIPGVFRGGEKQRIAKRREERERERIDECMTCPKRQRGQLSASMALIELVFLQCDAAQVRPRPSGAYLARRLGPSCISPPICPEAEFSGF